MKSLFDIYVYTKCLLKKYTHNNNQEKLFTSEISNYRENGYSRFTLFSFESETNKFGFYRGEHAMKKFCRDLKEHAIEVINFE